MTTAGTPSRASATTPTVPSTTAVGRALRRLNAPEARRFVAALLAARGYRTAIEGSVVTAKSATGRPARLLVVTGVGSLAEADRADAVDAVVTAGGPVAAAVAALLARLAARRGDRDPPDRVGPATLREWLVYAVGEDDRAALTDRYLGATEPSAVERVADAVAGKLSALADAFGSPGRPSRRAVAAVIVAVVAVAATVASGTLVSVAPTGSTLGSGMDSGPDAGTSSSTRTVSRITAGPSTAAAPVVPVSNDTGARLPEVCPLAPVGIHPATLRPAVREGVNPSGLEDTEFLVAQNFSRSDFDPNDRQGIAIPVTRHIAVYERPDGTRYRLRIDRWDSPSRARAAAPATRSEPLGFSWGAYVVWVTWRPDETGRPYATQILAAVTTAEGIQLGERCVRALLDEFDGVDPGGHRWRDP